jgi:hypothetical protein
MLKSMAGMFGHGKSRHIQAVPKLRRPGAELPSNTTLKPVATRALKPSEPVWKKAYRRPLPSVSWLTVTCVEKKGV